MAILKASLILRGSFKGDIFDVHFGMGDSWKAYESMAEVATWLQKIQATIS